jgi:hypothetical protein
MSDQFRPPIVDPLAGGDDVESADRERREEARRRGLPEHEIDEDETVGGGVMASGGTAIDRGTGTLGGQAQGTDPAETADDTFEGRDVADQVVPEPMNPNDEPPRR